MAVTLADIAEMTGFSRATVSMALRNHPEISSRTCVHLQKIARAAGYRAYASARALSTKRYHTVTFVMGGLQNPAILLGSYPECVEGAATRLAEADYKLLLSAQPPRSHKDRDWIPDILREHSYDGLLVFMPPIPHIQQELQNLSGCPYVVVDSPPLEGISTVGMDEEQQARVLTEYLIELGHRKIGFVNAIGTIPGWRPHPRVHLRELGYLRAMIDAGLRPSQGNEQTIPVIQRLAQLFTGDDRPTALIFYGSGAAYEGIQWLGERGLKVPDDVSVTSITDFPKYRLADITCAKPRWEEIGRTAVEILLGQLTKPANEPRSILLMTDVEVRKTTGPPPGTNGPKATKQTSDVTDTRQGGDT
ncbi:MAG: substrate-binding domain-containing protein [Actinobacteria bacterium]|nr:substrate-binding domain-containing protein [Actinomycetota bacterium]